jgi:hypothetical protein
MDLCNLFLIYNGFRGSVNLSVMIFLRSVIQDWRMLYSFRNISRFNRP